MDYINYYKKLENDNIISKNKSFNMIKNRNNRLMFKKTNTSSLVVFILCLKDVFNNTLIDLELLPSIIAMINLPNIKCYEEARIIYNNKVNEYNLKQFKNILNLNYEYNKYNTELTFNLRCEIPNSKSTLNNQINTVLNNINYNSDCLKNKLQLEQQKLHIIVILRSILVDDPDNIDAILSYKFQLDEIDIDLHNINNNTYNKNINNNNFSYHLNSYLNINKINKNLKCKLLKIEDDINKKRGKIMINKISKNIGMYEKESLKHITPCNKVVNDLITIIKNEIKE